MKVIYRYRSDLSCSIDDIIQELKKQQQRNRANDWSPAEIKKISTEYEDNDHVTFDYSRYGHISFTAWNHYGIMLENGEIFADLGKKSANAIEERKRLKDYIESGGVEDYIELDDIVL